MIHRIFSIYDNAVKTWAPPFTVQHVQYALRYFETLANDQKSDVAKYPSQFHLFELGEFDDETGDVNRHTQPVSIGLASSYVKEQ